MKDIFNDDQMKKTVIDAIGSIVSDKLIPNTLSNVAEHDELLKYSDCTNTIYDLFMCCDAVREKARLKNLAGEILFNNNEIKKYDRFLEEFRMLIDNFRSEYKHRGKLPKIGRNNHTYPFERLNTFFTETYTKYKGYGEVLKDKLSPLE